MTCWSDPQCLLFVGSAVLGSLVLAIYIAVKAITTPYPEIVRHEEERYFFDPITRIKEPFPLLNDKPTVSLSVIVPAYEEEQRLPKMLDECLDYLENRTNKDNNFQYEVIIVSDGGKDSTVEVALQYSKKYSSNKVRVLELIKNRGKGGAVRLGMLSARGRWLLFADADGATKFQDLDKLEDEMKKSTPSDEWEKPAIVIGSRAHLEDEAIASRSIFRTILMHGFHFLVWLFAVRGIRDTQCGFKLLTRSAAQDLFTQMHVERWAFDVELLFLAQSLKIEITEVCVNWTEIEGSKITPVWTWIQMGRDLFLIWFRYTIGAWQISYNRQKKAKQN